MTGRFSGGPVASPPLVRAVRYCADGQWRDLEEVLYEAGKAVPPGKAMRRTEMNRLHQGGPPERAIPRETQRLVEVGRRSIAKDFVRPPWFQIDPSGQQPRGTTQKVRLVKFPLRIDLTEVPIEAMRWAQPDAKDTKTANSKGKGRTRENADL